MLHEPWNFSSSSWPSHQKGVTFSDEHFETQSLSNLWRSHSKSVPKMRLKTRSVWSCVVLYQILSVFRSAFFKKCFWLKLANIFTGLTNTITSSVLPLEILFLSFSHLSSPLFSPHLPSSFLPSYCSFWILHLLHFFSTYPPLDFVHKILHELFITASPYLHIYTL